MVDTELTPEEQQEQFEAGLERAGLAGENKTFAELFLSGVGGGNAIDPKMLKQANEYYNSLQSSVQQKKGEKATEYGKRLGSLYDKLQESQDKPMSGGEIIARAVIGLAPTLIGAAAGSAMGIGTGLGGAAGGAAGIAGLSQLEQAREKQREQEQRRLASQIEGVRKIQEEELKTLGQTERDIEKAKLELPMLAGKGAMELKIAETKARAVGERAKAERPVTAEQAKQLGGFDSAIKELDMIDEAIGKNKSSMGPFAGRAFGSSPYATQTQAFKSRLNLAQQNIGVSLEAGKLTDMDIERYKKMLPNINDTPDVARQKVQVVKELIAMKRAAALESMQAAGFRIGGYDRGKKQAPMTDLELFNSLSDEQKILLKNEMDANPKGNKSELLRDFVKRMQQ